MRDLNSNIPGAPNFKYKEFIKSEQALRFGIDNIPKTEEIWKNIEKLAANCLQPIREEFGLINVTSGYRTPQLCVLIGSSATSNHALGQAADIEPVDNSIKLINILNWIHDNLTYRELIAEYFPNGWIHIAFRENGNDEILKLKDSKHNYIKVSIEYINSIYMT